MVTMRNAGFIVLWFVLLVSSCFPSMDGARFKCETDRDCQMAGMVCGAEKACVAPLDNGTTPSDVSEAGGDSMGVDGVDEVRADAFSDVSADGVDSEFDEMDASEITLDDEEPDSIEMAEFELYQVDAPVDLAQADVAVECSMGDSECEGKITLGPCEKASCSLRTGVCEAIPDVDKCMCPAPAYDCAAFEDGLACNGTLTCDKDPVAPRCAVDPNTVPACPSDQDTSCRENRCVEKEPGTWACEITPIHQGLACDDGDACTNGEACYEGLCKNGSAVSCDDGKLCTTDWCDETNGCHHDSNSLECAAARCEGGKTYPAVACLDKACPEQVGTECPEDDNPCTDAVCDGGGKACLQLPHVGSCTMPGKPGCVATCVGTTCSLPMEICDGEDNDCDGITDDGYTYLDPFNGLDLGIGEACHGFGACGLGIVVCAVTGGPKATCSTNPDGPASQATEEVCTATGTPIDEDCDGWTDEEGASYCVGYYEDVDGDKYGKNGVKKCLCTKGNVPNYTASVGLDCDDSDPNVHPKAAELCNAKDDDCDSLTDEDFPVGEACNCPPSLCFNGHFECDPLTGGVKCVGCDETSTQEICDGQDNDCDGVVDNGFTYSGVAFGQPCLGAGLCGVGVVECATPNQATCSTNPDGSNRQDKPEVCDGLDNNCDGRTDEGLTYQGVSLGDDCIALGECGAGKVVCSPTDLTATCSTSPNGTNPGNSPETCDGKDNDCNGITDDVLVPDTSGCRLGGVCSPTTVTALCVNAQWVCDYSGVSGFMEVETGCDGRDNDCDGITDEGYTYHDPVSGLDVDVGGSCSGYGACGAGVVVCAVFGGPKATCSTNPDGPTSQATQETCTASGTAIDEDCDGLTDEEGAKNCQSYYKDVDGDLHGQPGVTKCYCKGKQVAPYTALVGNDCNDNDPAIYAGHPEVCDDKDNNCNDQTDEGAAFVDKGKACDGDDADTCANGKFTCSIDGSNLVCTGDYNGPETCNGIDDDCNGLTDETFTLGGKAIGQSCDGTGECGIGAVECLPTHDAVTCSTNPNGSAHQNTAEKCNAKDDDCDGLTDEDFPGKSTLCDGADADQCKQGTWTCKADGSGLQCINEPVPPNPPTTELCDGVDNDCSGVTDDPWVATKDTKCNNNTGEPVPCATGIQVCKPDGSGVRCVDKDTHGTEKDCVYLAKCRDSGELYQPDECRCQKTGGTWGQLCTTDIGSTCDTINGNCLCGASPACTYPLKCLYGTCQ
jgi:hypothetical protein